MLLELPNPTQDALQHSKALENIIIQACKKNNDKITFKQFMQHALYYPGFGYYSAGSQKFGPAGDFVTAPEISDLFGQSIAHFIVPILNQIKDNNTSILELGAGSGKLAKDILQTLDQLNTLPEKYYILEVSADLRKRQQSYLSQHFDNGIIERIEWLDTLPKNTVNGVILANEVLDAMPITAFRMAPNTPPKERYVSYKNQTWQLQHDIPSTPETALALKEFQKVLVQKELLKSPIESEINLDISPWLLSLSDGLNQGVILLIDYGFPQHEYYHPDRTMGTLMCHYRHRAHGDIFKHIGLQDITAHVDFTYLAESALNSQLEVLGFTTQQAFLLDNQITQLAEKAFHSSNNPHSVAQQMQQLISPNEMGELFKVIALGKNWSSPINGFKLRDFRGNL